MLYARYVWEQRRFAFHNILVILCAGGQQAAGMAVTSGADGGYMDLMTCEQAAHVILEAGATGKGLLLPLQFHASVLPKQKSQVTMQCRVASFQTHFIIG